MNLLLLLLLLLMYQLNRALRFELANEMNSHAKGSCCLHEIFFNSFCFFVWTELRPILVNGECQLSAKICTISWSYNWEIGYSCPYERRWLFGLEVTRWSWSTYSCSTSGLVSTRMGDRSQYTILVFNGNQSHPGLLILAIPPRIGTMSTGGCLGYR